MKKAWFMVALVLAAVLAVSCALAENASVTTYHMKDIGISAELDSDIPVYMAGDQEIGEAYTGLGLTKEYMDNLMTENKLSLHALVNKGSRELTINSLPLAMEEFGSQSEETLETLKANIVNQYVSMGAEVRDSTFTEAEIGKVLCVHYSFKSGIYTNHLVQYSALKEKRMVNLRMSSYNGWPSREDEEWLLKVLNSLKWEEAAESETVLPEGNTTYHLESAKLSLELPTALPVYCCGDADVNDQYKARGINKQTMDQMMEANAIYLHALVNYGGELFVIVSPLEGVKPEDVTEEERSVMMEQMKAELEKSGATVTMTEIADMAPGKAIHCVFKIVIDGITQEYEQYSLFGQGCIVVVRMNNYAGGLTGEEKTLVQEAANSIRWDE